MNKVIWPSVIRWALGIAIAWMVKGHAVSADAAAHMMAGDTTPLWGGALNFNMTQAVDILTNWQTYLLIGPLISAWRAKIIDHYKALIARLTPTQLPPTELDRKVDAASMADKIKSVSAQRIVTTP